MKMFINVVMKRIYLFNTVAWNYRKKIGLPVCKKENLAGLQVHRKRGMSARASPTPHHTLNKEQSARFTAQHLYRFIYQSYWAAMNKIFIYARPCVNKMTCSAVFFVPFPKYPKIDGNDKKNFLDFFLEFSFVLATQSNCKSVEDVWKIIEPEWFVEKSAVKTDIY